MYNLNRKISCFLKKAFLKSCQISNLAQTTKRPSQKKNEHKKKRRAKRESWYIMTKRRTLTSETDYGSHSNVISLFLYLLLSSASETKASCKKLSSWIDLSLTLDGRDKITKTIQYTCRFLAWWYGNNKFRAMRLRNLQKSLTSRYACVFMLMVDNLHIFDTLKNNPFLLLLGI